MNTDTAEAPVLTSNFISKDTMDSWSNYVGQNQWTSNLSIVRAIVARSVDIHGARHEQINSISAGLVAVHYAYPGREVPAMGMSTLSTCLSQIANDGDTRRELRELARQVQANLQHYVYATTVGTFSGGNFEGTLVGLWSQGVDLFDSPNWSSPYNWASYLSNTDSGESTFRAIAHKIESMRNANRVCNFVRAILFLQRECGYSMSDLQSGLSTIESEVGNYTNKCLAGTLRERLSDILYHCPQASPTSAGADSGSTETSATPLNLLGVTVSRPRVGNLVETLSSQGGIEQLWSNLIRPLLRSHLDSRRTTSFQLDAVATLYALREMNMDNTTISEGLYSMYGQETSGTLKSFLQAVHLHLASLLNSPLVDRDSSEHCPTDSLNFDAYPSVPESEQAPAESSAEYTEAPGEASSEVGPTPSTSTGEALACVTSFICTNDPIANAEALQGQIRSLIAGGHQIAFVFPDPNNAFHIFSFNTEG